MRLAKSSLGRSRIPRRDRGSDFRRHGTIGWRRRAATALLSLLALIISYLASQAAHSQQAPDEIRSQGLPTIIFVHGRGQSDKSPEEVRNRFFGAFTSSQQKEFGTEIVPASQFKFVWYSDLMDPKSKEGPQSENCKFGATPTLSATFRSELLESLIRVAQAAKLDAIGMSVLASDTYKYLTHPEVRCDTDSRIAKAVYEAAQQGPVIVVAHSMGGIVSFSAFEKLATTFSVANRPKIAQFITVGTQVGLPIVIQGLQGQFVNVPVPLPNIIEKWKNFMNTADGLAFATRENFLATNELRRPVDLEIKPFGSPHAIETYLGDRDVIKAIVGSWCEAQSVPKTSCPKRGEASREASLSGVEIPTALVAMLAHFFGVAEPKIEPQFSSESRTHVVATIDPDAPFYMEVSIPEFVQYRSAVKLQRFSDALRFGLGHEFAHIAQQRVAAKRGTISSTISECEADLWSGFAFVSVLPLDASPSEAMKRVTGLVGVAAEMGDLFPLGSHAAERSPSSHPVAIQRALCTMRGMSLGLALIRQKQLQTSRSTSAKERSELADVFRSLLFKPAQDLWEWSLLTAKSIDEANVGNDAAIPPTLTIRELKTLAAAAESGSAALRSTGTLTARADGIVCRYEGNGHQTGATCEGSAAPSVRLAFVGYDAMLGQLRPLLLSRGWSIVSTTRSTSEMRECFSKGSALSIATLDTVRNKVLLEFRSAG